MKSGGAPWLRLPRSTTLRVIGLLVAVAGLAVVPFVTDRQDVLNLLFLVFLYGTLSQSWNILGGFGGQVNLGHAAFFGLGALVTRTMWLGGLPFFVAFVCGGLTALAFGLIIGIPTFRLRGAYFAIGTLGVAEVLRITTGNVLTQVSSMPANLVATYNLTLRYELALWVVVACTATAARVLRSRFGLGILAVREDESAAQASGVNPLRHKLAALSLSSLFAGLAGGVFAFYHVSYYADLAFSPTWTFDAVLPVYVGGVGTLAGPIVGTIFYILVREQLAVTLVGGYQIIFGALFILVVLAMPGGIVGAGPRVPRAIARLRARLTTAPSAIRPTVPEP
jgi:branched-chain amino acid transport system permease protein